jgi:hypothetical protein
MLIKKKVKLNGSRLFLCTHLSQSPDTAQWKLVFAMRIFARRFGSVILMEENASLMCSRMK